MIYHKYAKVSSFVYFVFSIIYSFIITFGDSKKVYPYLEIPDIILYTPLFLLSIMSLKRLKKGFIDFDILSWLEFNSILSKIHIYSFYLISTLIFTSGIFWIITTSIYIILFLLNTELNETFHAIQETFSSLISLSLGLLMVYILSFIFLLTLNNSSNLHLVTSTDKIENYQACN